MGVFGRGGGEREIGGVRVGSYSVEELPSSAWNRKYNNDNAHPPYTHLFPISPLLSMLVAPH